MQILTDSLFYKGGTIEYNNCKNTCYNGYKIAFNDIYLFIIDHSKIIGAIEYQDNTDYSYKLLKTKIKIVSKDNFIAFVSDPTFESIVKIIVRNIANNFSL